MDKKDMEMWSALKTSTDTVIKLVVNRVRRHVPDEERAETLDKIKAEFNMFRQGAGPFDPGAVASTTFGRRSVRRRCPKWCAACSRWR